MKVPIEKLNAIVERARTEPLPAGEHATLKHGDPCPEPGCDGRLQDLLSSSKFGGQIGARGSGASPRRTRVVASGLAALRPVAPRRRSHGVSGRCARCWSQIGNCWDLLRGLDGEDIAALAAASEPATAWLLGAMLPEETGAAILAHFDRLGSPLVAVRSSANAEDRADSAWAGQLETCLGTTRADLLDHVRRCWASLFTPRALACRFQNRMMATGISVAVVV